MASPSPFQAEDQTDEDFFDKLVDDDFSIEKSQPDSGDIARELSSLSLGDVANSLDDNGDAEFASESKEWKQNESVQLPETPQKDLSISELSVQSDFFVSQAAGSGNSTGDTTEIAASASSTLKSSESKSSGIKEVQWSAFSMNFGQLEKGEEEPQSAFLVESADALASELKADAETTVTSVGNQGHSFTANTNSSEFQNAESLTSVNLQNSDWNESQSWENAYPGWKYDSATGQWYQVDGYDISSSGQSETFDAVSINSQQSFHDNVQAADIPAGTSDILYLQQSSQPVLDTIEENSILNNVSNWKLSSEGSIEYPPNMVFDPQYPGWYYDTKTQQWCTLETYNQITQKGDVVDQQVNQEQTTSAGFSETTQSLYDGYTVSESKPVQGHSHVGFSQDWNASPSFYAQSNEKVSTRVSAESHSLHNQLPVPEEFSIQDQNNVGFSGDSNASSSTYAHSNIWQPGHVVKSAQFDSFSGNQQTGNSFSYAMHTGSQTAQQVGLENFRPVSSHNYSYSNGFIGSHSFNPGESMYQFSQPKLEPSSLSHLSTSYYSNQNSVNSSKQQLHSVNSSYSQFSYASNEGRSSDGRPAHALVTFGFGGKLVVMKNSVSLGTTFDHGNQGNVHTGILIHNLSEVVKDTSKNSAIVEGSASYFDTLCQQSFPGPLVGGNAATKDVNKWLDERISACDSPGMDFQRAKFLRLLLSLLKILCQHYGKLRSHFGSDSSNEDTDGAQMALTKLFASAKKTNAPYREYDKLTHFMQNIPSEAKMRATATEVQNLLVSGRRKEALQCAQEGHLWGPALVLATQLGDEFYVETVKKMAQNQFIPGSPLRTLCLLIAGQPADIFSSYSSKTSLSNGLNAPQQPSEIHGSGMLDDWEENLAIITANRTKDDELVILYLGDCLMRERGQVTAAHTCYLVAEANFESYCTSTRLCLVGADHWKYPRTYASPNAIQRTEVYEYSKVLGNSQFILLPFQPYKLVYAYMLAEVGKVSDSLRYCQACIKLLKNSSRAPEVETWKSLFSSLEERLRTHQQGGYNTNLAPTKLVGKLFTSIDKSIHALMGTQAAPLPPLPPAMTVPSLNDKELCSVSKVGNSQPAMTVPSLISSASVEAMSQWTNDSSRKPMHSRSISEPDFGRTPKQDAGPNGDQSRESVSGGSRFGRISSQLFQKTMGWMSKSNRQAKLGEQNKFYYDEKLKRWVEEGAALPAEEPVIAPPPIAASFQNGMPDHNANNGHNNENPVSFEKQNVKPPIPLGNHSGTPPVPPSQNQFSARARMGVRSRYVDTFNKSGTAFMGSFQSPAVPSVKPVIGANFFVPTTSATPNELGTEEPGQNEQACSNREETSTSILGEPSYASPPSSLFTTIQRFPSMDNITPVGNKASGAPASNHLNLSRAASWGGTCSDTFSTMMSELTPSNGHNTTSFLPNATSNNDSSSSSSMAHKSGAPPDELHEVEL